MKEILINYIKAGYAGLYIVSHEEPRVCATIAAATTQEKYHLFAWSVTEGLIDTHEDEKAKVPKDAVEVLQNFLELEEKSLLILRDFHLYLNEPNPMIFRLLKDAIHQGKATQKVIVIVGCQLKLPPELEKEITVIDYSLPDKPQLKAVMDGLIENNKKNKLAAKEEEAVLEAASGLTTAEAENAFALSVIVQGKICPQIVAREKALTIRKNGLLEVVETPVSLNDVGGLDQLKDWLLKRRRAFSKEAETYRLPRPKGMLAVGPPGTGKSLTAKATAAVFECPLLRLDAGRIFGSLIGQSEANLRTIIQTAEAVAPCVLWCDEVEKAFSGSSSSGQTDGGTTARVFGNFLQWMNDKTKPVFVVMTANDITKLPPEFLRKGRLDEIWFIDLPNPQERESIWQIQITKFDRDPKDFDIPALAKKTEGFTGAEIESIFADALYSAFDDGVEPDDSHVLTAIQSTTPLSKTMATEIETLRKWQSGKARPATAPVTVKAPTGRRVAA